MIIQRFKVNFQKFVFKIVNILSEILPVFMEIPWKLTDRNTQTETVDKLRIQLRPMVTN